MGDSVVIFLLALMLFGPKKLPQLARQLGKLMAEFRKASNDFRMQMEDELRLEEQKEHQAKVEALNPPPSTVGAAELPAGENQSASLSVPDPAVMAAGEPAEPHGSAANPEPETSAEAAAEPIAESGGLRMMPPASGLPAESSARGRTWVQADETTHFAEGSMGAGLGASTGAGSSSEEPVEELEPPPDRSQPVMVGEGERATHA